MTCLRWLAVVVSMNVVLAAQQDFVGTWDFRGGCDSTYCCCPTGEMKVFILDGVEFFVGRTFGNCQSPDIFLSTHTTIIEIVFDFGDGFPMLLRPGNSANRNPRTLDYDNADPVNNPGANQCASSFARIQGMSACSVRCFFFS